MVRAGPIALLLLLLWPLAACGVRPQSEPDPVPLTGVPAPSRPPVGTGSEGALLYFVSGARLAPVSRAVAERTPQDVVDLLVAGPTQPEVMSGLRTALAPQHLSVLADPDGLATVAVGRDFTSIDGGNQLLVVAQLVWTVTQFGRIDRVRFRSDGALVEVPTDAGLTGRPVTRTDYASVAPRGPAGTGTGTSRGSPTSGTVTPRPGG